MKRVSTIMLGACAAALVLAHATSAAADAAQTKTGRLSISASVVSRCTIERKATATAEASCVEPSLEPRIEVRTENGHVVTDVHF